MSDKIQLYFFPTPNGQKISIALEEMNLPYEMHKIDITKGDQFDPEYVAINPNSKIPSIVDPHGPGHRKINLMESGAILVYLAQKTNLFWSSDPLEQSRILQWLFFQVGGVGPMFGQFGHFFKFAADKCKDPYPVERYKKETQRILGVLEKNLSKNRFLAGNEYTIADMATMPWVHCLSEFYNAGEFLNLKEFERVSEWVHTLTSRPKTMKGLTLS